jgi:hypothetical protein
MIGLRQDERCESRFAVFRADDGKKVFSARPGYCFFIRISFLASIRAFQKSLTV